MTAVFDASVVVKALTEEPLSEEAAAALAQEPRRLAPDLLVVEVASALSKKVRYSDLPYERIPLALRSINHLVPELIPSAELLQDATAMSIELRHALYDCLYLALAERVVAPLVTADEKFAQAVAQSRWSSRVHLLAGLAS